MIKTFSLFLWLKTRVQQFILSSSLELKFIFPEKCNRALTYCGAGQLFLGIISCLPFQPHMSTFIMIFWNCAHRSGEVVWWSALHNFEGYFWCSCYCKVQTIYHIFYSYCGSNVVFLMYSLSMCCPKTQVCWILLCQIRK